MTNKKVWCGKTSTGVLMQLARKHT